jgi:hypothetical protein
MIYSHKELLEMAAPLFKQGEKRAWATVDGNIFYENSKADAETHNNFIKGSGVIELLPDDIEVKPKKLKQNVGIE